MKRFNTQDTKCNTEPVTLKLDRPIKKEHAVEGKLQVCVDGRFSFSARIV